MIALRQAKEGEAQIGAGFIEEAKIHQREQGFVQWTENSPNENHVIRDIELMRGYFLTQDQVPIGYLSIDFAGEPAYDHIQGEWLTDQNYAVIHRLAIGAAGRGKGATRELFRLVREMCTSKGIYAIRIDTGEQNKKMQHVLEREGFRYCGIVSYPVGLRLAYELDFTE